MQKGKFIPTQDKPRVIWLNNLAAKLPSYNVKYAITAAEVTDVMNSSVYYAAVMTAHEEWDAFGKAFTAFKDGVADGIEPGAIISPPTPPVITLPSGTAVPPPAIFVRMATLGVRIKAHPSYEIADGENMGLEGSVLAGRGTETPLLKLVLVAGGLVSIRWKKVQGTDSVEIQVDRGTGWELLAVANVSGYVDPFTLPAGTTASWKYRAIYRYKNNRDGDWGAAASILVSGS